MKKIIITLFVLIVFGCSVDKPPQTDLIISNIGKSDFVNLWFSIENNKIEIDSLKSGENKIFKINAIGNKRIDYGFKGDENLRKKMGGKLFLYGNQIPDTSGVLEVGLEDGLIHKIVSKHMD